MVVWSDLELDAQSMLCNVACEERTALASRM